MDKVNSGEFSLKGKVALITGAAQGIGKAIAACFADHGANMVLVDIKQDITKVSEEMKKDSGQEIHPVIHDLTETENIRKTVNEAESRFGKIDILVNNAGIVLLEKAEALPEDYWDKTMAINLKVPFMMAQAVGKKMIRAGGGKIINLASQAGIVALDKHVAYCTSKAGIISLTKVLAYEWGKYGINVNAISPTVVLTELGKKAWAGEVGEKMKEKIPIGRFALPEEIANVALFLASKKSDMVHGENLVIDGGYTIQ